MDFMDGLGPLQSLAEPVVKSLTQIAVDMKVQTSTPLSSLSDSAILIGGPSHPVSESHGENS